MAIHRCVGSRETLVACTRRNWRRREREREFKEQVIVATYYLSAVSLSLFSRTRLESVRTRKEENTRLGMVEKKEEREKKASYTRALFNLDARKHWINDLRERKTPFTEPFRLHGGDGVSRRILGYGKIHGIPREGERNKRERNAASGTRDARKRVFNVFSSGAEPLGAHLDGIKSGHPFENRPCS